MRNCRCKLVWLILLYVACWQILTRDQLAKDSGKLPWKTEVVRQAEGWAGWDLLLLTLPMSPTWKTLTRLPKHGSKEGPSLRRPSVAARCFCLCAS